MSVDVAYEVAKSIIDNALTRIEQIRSEEDAKVQIITRLITEALGWSHNDISCESLNENGFSDYLVNDEEQTAFVIEAKKIGVIEINTKTRTCGYYKISGPVLKQAQVGIRQVASYCQPLGIGLAVLTDGVTWIVFLPWVPQAKYTDRQAIVFPGFTSILDSFSTFYELLSKSHSKRGTYRIVFDSIHENRLVLDRELVSPVSPNENSIVQKSGLAFDLEGIFSTFFSNLTGDRDPDMLVDCFVETRESQIADFSLERLTKNVLGNIDPSGRDVDAGLQTVVRNAVSGGAGQTIFIVGPSGAGKSTFLDRFFIRTLAPDVRERCIVVKINFLDATGDEVVALPWMTERAIKTIEKQLFEDGIPNWNDLLALYHSEYVRRSKGVDSILYERSKDEFREKFSFYIDEQVERDREGYLRRLLADIVKNRRKLPIFVIDNTDEFGLDYKTMVFQYFQALSRVTDHCLLIFPATDKSAWTFARTDIFNIYSSKSFFLPTPSPREVFKTRVEYLRKKEKETRSKKESAEYVAGRGFRVSIQNLTAFASVIETIFVEQDDAAKRIGQLANYNIRKALDLAKRVVTSSVLNLEDLIRSYATGDMVAPSMTHFSNALVRGDYQLFKPGDEPLIFPLFQVDSTIRQSPLIFARILVLLYETKRNAAEDTERYMTVSSVFAYCGIMSMSEAAIQRALESLLTAGLIEPYDLSKKDYSDNQRLAITFSGLAHLNLGVFNPVFFEQFALTTRIGDKNIADQIRNAYKSSGSVNDRLGSVRELFAKYICKEDSRHCRIPDRPEFSGQVALTEDIKAEWIVSRPAFEQMWRSPGVVAELVQGVVENFDHNKGYGFVEIESLQDTVFLHARIVEQGDFPDVFDGDEIVCDVTANEKGFTVSRIHSVTTCASMNVTGVIVKLFKDRGYGFINIRETGVDAFFHYHLFSPKQQQELKEGQQLFVETKADKTGRVQVRRVVWDS